ncbi:hypothetical protein SAMD00019534_086060, partial [Acytostelium subglobosum LB1]|uniref:hypothetical protein n=1 Tax=Acytostelium subglobosum LB1 TaxID=1410327 RepID=UPI0006448BE3
MSTTSTTKTSGAPEAVLRRRATSQKKNLMFAKAERERPKAKTTTLRFKRAEKYTKEYRNSERENNRLDRLAKNPNAKSLKIPSDAKIAFVIRIRGVYGIAQKPKKVLQLLRLLQLNNGVFVKLNPAMINMLKIVEPYIAYGYPNHKSVKELIYKRGFAKIDGQRLPITNNEMIEEHLGRHGMLCVEDLVHEIFTCGKYFRVVNQFLWPFKLNCPRGGVSTKKTNVIEGGDSGNQEHLINNLIQKMN